MGVHVRAGQTRTPVSLVETTTPHAATVVTVATESVLSGKSVGSGNPAGRRQESASGRRDGAGLSRRVSARKEDVVAGAGTGNVTRKRALKVIRG